MEKFKCSLCGWEHDGRCSDICSLCLLNIEKDAIVLFTVIEIERDYQGRKSVGLRQIHYRCGVDILLKEGKLS